MKLSDDLLVTNHWYLPELVPPDIFHDLGIKSKEKLSPTLLNILKNIREQWGKPLFINNWHNKYDGSLDNVQNILNDNSLLKYCGFRPENCKEGAIKSDHKTGEAADLHVLNDSIINFYYFILHNIDKFPELTKIEDRSLTINQSGNGWVHISVAPIEEKSVYVIGQKSIIIKIKRG